MTTGDLYPLIQCPHSLPLTECDDCRADEDVPVPRDDKYVVVRREDWEGLKGLLLASDVLPVDPEWLESYALLDAAVIRTKDFFAGPTLNLYAHNMASAAIIERQHGDPLGRARGMQAAADYFAARAHEADERAHEMNFPD